MDLDGSTSPRWRSSSDIWNGSRSTPSRSSTSLCGRSVLEEWESVLSDLERDPALTADRLDWVAKRRLIDGYIERDGLQNDDPKLRGLDLQYHDVDPTTSLYHRWRRPIRPDAPVVHRR
jgi:hypothetical protein